MLSEVEQIASRIPLLTGEQIAQMNSALLPIREIVEADGLVGAEVASVMEQFDGVDGGVQSVVRTALLGIFGEGQVSGEVSATLKRAWTDIVEPFNTPVEAAAEPADETDDPGAVMTPVEAGSGASGIIEVNLTVQPGTEFSAVPSESALTDLGESPE